MISRNQYHLCVGYGGKQIVHIPHFFSKGLAMEQISADEEKLYVFLPHILNDLLKGLPNLIFPPPTPGISRIRSRPQMYICQMDKTHTTLLSKLTYLIFTSAGNCFEKAILFCVWKILKRRAAAHN